jgi:stage II sporulation protein D
VPNYHTQVRVGAEQFRETLLAACPEADLSGSPDQWLGAAEYSSSGGVTALTIGGVSLSGVQLRSLYGLRSTHFTLTAEGEELVFQVTGYGHGVGMSQYGANAMAQAGSDWREILTWYYTGVTVETCPLWA